MTNGTTIKPDAVVRRLYACGKWKLGSVAHFGGDETGVADMCLLRDAKGNPFIPAASIAGAARSFLARQCQSWTDYKKGKESREFKNFFGDSGKDDPMSALFVADAACVPKWATTSIRDGVRVNTKSGSAADKAKFDVEVLERGTEFELSFECVICESDDQSKFEELFVALLHGFQEGDIRLGARTRRGYGRGKVESWEIRDLEMNKPEDVMSWLYGDFPNGSEEKCEVSSSELTDKRRYFQIEADFNLRTSLLIRSVSEDPEAPDMVHLQSAGEFVVPGTSFAGTFRHRSMLIAKTIGWHESAVSEMFGPVHKQDERREEIKQTDLWASRVWIEEQLVKDVEDRWQDRVAIDRFTGGSLQSALFNEKPVYPVSIPDLEEKASASNLRLILTLEEPEKAEIGLLLLTLRDFWYGHAALGGETSNGRGTLQGIKAQVWFKDSDAPDAKIWNFSHKDGRMTLDEEDAAFIECCIKETQDYSGSPAGSRRPDE